MRNDANITATGLAFVAVVTLDAGRRPVKFYTTDVIPVNLAPGGETDVDVGLLPQADWGRLGAIFPKIQVMCALAKVTYANGSVWEVTPNPAARTADEALSLPPSEVSRSQISKAAMKGMNASTTAAPPTGWARSSQSDTSLARLPNVLTRHRRRRANEPFGGLSRGNSASSDSALQN